VAETSRHIAYDRLVAYVLDPLDEAQSEAIRAHLEICPSCRVTANRLGVVREQLRVSESHKPSPQALARAKAVFGRQQLLWRERLGRMLLGPEWYQWRLGLTLLLLLALAIAGARTVVDQSRTALPGDRLYLVRRIAEKFDLATMFSDVEQAKMHVTLIRTRVKDLMDLTVAGRYKDIPLAVSDFRAEIDDTTASFRAVADYDQAHSIMLVQQVEQSLNDGAQSLATLALAGPAEARPIIRSAVEAAVAGKNIVRTQLPVVARTALDAAAPQLTLPPVAVTALADSTWSATLAFSATQPLTSASTGTLTMIASASSSPTKGTHSWTATPRPSPTAPISGALTSIPEATLTPVATASATATGTPLPTATDTALPTDTRTPPPSKTLQPTPTVTPWPTQTELLATTITETPRPTATAAPSDTPLPTDTNTSRPPDTPVPSDTPGPTDTPIPTDIRPPTDTNEPPPTNTHEPSPTDTNVPTPNSTDVPPATTTDVVAALGTAELARVVSLTISEDGGGGGPLESMA
jgi:hypothetical protein